MLVDQFDFELPEDRIALRPIEPRDASRLLVVKPGQPFRDAQVRDLGAFLEPGDCLVFNDTRVLPAFLQGTRRRGDASVHVTLNLVEWAGPASWWVLAKPGRRLQPGDRIHFTCENGNPDAALSATVLDKADDGRILLEFSLQGEALGEALRHYGRSPLPPYIASKRAADERDLADYQTLFAERDGAVAAPTAGLHFTQGLLDRLTTQGIGHEFVTLHVGAGTFLPVKVDRTKDHAMHAEYGEITGQVADRLNKVRADGGRIIAVGTTSLRVLESAANEQGQVEPMARETRIFITPGYQFRATDILMTNFHLPKSTLFMLVSAFSGLQEMKAAYQHAIAHDYRFYSYGDACLLFPDRTAP